MRRRSTDERQRDLDALARWFRQMGGRPSPQEPFVLLYAAVKDITPSSGRLDFWEVSQRTEAAAPSYGALLRQALIGGPVRVP